jgi:FAD synthase
LKLAGQATSYVGEVLDLSGRVVHRFSVGGNDRVFWDGRDLQQRRVVPGVYFVRVRGGGAEATSRVVVLR